MCGAAATGLITGRLPAAARLPAAVRRAGAAALALAAAAGALVATFLSLWNLAVASDEDGSYTWEDGDAPVEGERLEWAAAGVACGVGAVGLLVLAGLLAFFAATGRVPRPGPFAQSLAAAGVLVAGGSFAALVLTAAIRGDYP